jgi:hypothetical protein
MNLFLAVFIVKMISDICEIGRGVENRSRNLGHQINLILQKQNNILPLYQWMFIIKL